MTSIEKITELLPQCFLLKPIIHEDNRGAFIKTIHTDMFAELDLSINIKEEFFSISNKDVLRGMHLQLPPAQHNKLISCIQGEMLDVVLDLRKGQGYGKFASVVLSDKNYHQLYVPKGVAHGFLSLKDQSILLYRTDSLHNQSCDHSLKWNSFGFDWGLINPITSYRDATAPKFKNFMSPF